MVATIISYKLKIWEKGVIVVSTVLSGKIFFNIDILLEFLMAWEISLSISVDGRR